jgi:transcriptional regulator with XRE-family HTH domain
MIKQDLERLQAQVGELLRAARESANKTQSDVAKEINKNQSHISEVEHGKINITLETLLALAGAAGCRVVVDLVPKRRPH